MFKRKPGVIEEVASKIDAFNHIEAFPPTLYQLELDVLAKESAELIHRREAVTEQETVVAETRSRIALMQDHPWLDSLYKVLRDRETT
jgi:hypothetical protein